MASNNTNGDSINNKKNAIASNNATSEEDNVLASLGTTRAETSNYESDVLRQATHRLAPTLVVNEDRDEAFRFPDFISSTSLLPFSAPNQAKANRKVVTNMLTQLQTQMKQLLLDNGGVASETLHLLTMKQQMLLSMLGRHSKKAAIQDLWNQQRTLEELYQQCEQQQTAGTTRRGRVSMMQRKQIPGASSLAKAQQLTKKLKSSKKAWKDWSSDENDSDSEQQQTNRIARSVLAEMNHSNRKRAPSTKKTTRTARANKKRKSQMKTTTASRKSEALSTNRPTRRNRTPVKSYADDESGDVEDVVETEETQNDVTQTEGDMGATEKGGAVQEEETAQQLATENDVNGNKSAQSSDRTTNDQEQEHNLGISAAVAPEASSEEAHSAAVTCPLCQHTWTVSDPNLVDEELSQHMALCQSTSGSERRSRRSQRATTSRAMPIYKEVDEDEDVIMGADEDKSDNDNSIVRRRGKRKISYVINEHEEEDFEGDADLDDDNDTDQYTDEKKLETDDNEFMFDKDMNDEDDEDLQAESDFPLEKPTAVDDYRLDDYEDRVDYWRLHGLSEMRDMSKLRAEGEIDPGAVTLSGGLHIPAWMNNRLFAYQRTGLEWMWTLHQQQAGGVMGDEMGLGKTVQVSSFLGAMAASRMLKGVLIISPATMLQHWLSELAVWAPGLRRVLLHASGDTSGGSGSVLDAPNRNVVNHGPAIIRNLRNWLRGARGEYLYERIDNPDGDDDDLPDDSFCGTGYAVVTTYEHVRRNQDAYVNHSWSYVVLDEAQKIRNPHADITLACKRLRTPHRIAMTGTPIQNDLKELWSLFDFVFPGRLGTLPAFEEEFAAPIKRGGYSNASPVQVQLAYRCSLVLRDLIDPYLLRRQKSEIEEVRRMPSKAEHVLFCRLSLRQRRMYEAFLASDMVKRIFKGSSLLFAAVTMLRKICNHPDLVLADPSDSALEAFLRNGCVPDEPVNNSDDEEDENEDYDPFPDAGSGSDLAERSGKFEVLSKILPLWKKEGHRVLIFSQWTKMLNIIQQFVVAQGWKFLRLDGKTNVASRQKLVDTFNTDTSYFGMLCTTRTGGVGLNLTGANRLILYDPDWNPQTDAQARERAWRFGQEKQVTVYRLCTAGTIEEKMYQRQIFKTALTNKVLHDPRQKRLFSQKDLHDLLTLQPDNGQARKTGEQVIETTNTIAKASKNEDAGGIHDVADASSGDGETLKRVLKSKGLAGVFDHNFVDPSSSINKSASVREMEEQAKRIAREAAEALQSSVNNTEAQDDDPFTPTWTGAPESRFGGGGPAGPERRGSASTFGGAATAGVKGSGTSKSSGSLLATLRQRNEAVQSGGKRRPSLTGSDSGVDTGKNGKYTKLMIRIKDYVEEHSPTSDEILDAFSAVPNCDAAIFKRLLNSVARVERGRWKLKPEHDS